MGSRTEQGEAILPNKELVQCWECGSGHFARMCRALSLKASTSGLGVRFKTPHPHRSHITGLHCHCQRRPRLSRQGPCRRIMWLWEGNLEGTGGPLIPRGVEELVMVLGNWGQTTEVAVLLCKANLLGPGKS